MNTVIVNISTKLFTVVVQLLSSVQLFVTPLTAAYQAPLSFTISWNLLKFISIELVMISYHLITSFHGINLLIYWYIFLWALFLTCGTMGFPGGSVVKNRPAHTGDAGLIPGSKDTLKEEMATYFSILSWKIPWTEEPGGLQSMGSQTAGHD